MTTSAATPFFSHAQAPIVFNVTVLKGKFLPGGHNGSTCVDLTLRVSRKVLHEQRAELQRAPQHANVALASGT